MGTKLKTGISGFDDLSQGGIPGGRTTVVLGGPGAGKTIFALQTLVSACRSGLPSVFVAFEESPEQIVGDAAGFDWKLDDLCEHGIAFVDARLSASLLQSGDFDLIGLLAVVAAKVRQTGAQCVVFDGLDVLLGHLADPRLIRNEVYRLKEWLETGHLTGLVTAKSSEKMEGFEFLQFLADCVVILKHRVYQGVALRSLCIYKYRGGSHAAGEFAFVITPCGIHVPTSARTDMTYPVSDQRVSTGVVALDGMLGQGYYRGSSIVISGAPGTAKTSLLASFAGPLAVVANPPCSSVSTSLPSRLSVTCARLAST